MVELPTSPELAAFLRRHRPVLLSAWIARVRAMHGSGYAGRSEAELAEWLGPGLDTMVLTLEAGREDAIRSHLESISPVRWEAGLHIDQVIHSLLHMRDAVVPCIREHLPGDTTATDEAIVAFDDVLRVFIARFSELYGELMRRHLRDERQRTSLVLGSAEVAASSIELDAILAHGASSLATALGVGWCGVFVSQDEGDVYRLRAVGGDDSSAFQRIGPSAPIEASGEDPFAQILGTSRPTVLRGDDTLFAGATCRELGASTAACVPFRVGGRPVALALGVSQDPTHRFGLEQLELAMGISRGMAAAIEKAHLYAAMRRQLAESRGLQRVTAALLGELDPQRILEVVCMEARTLLDAEGCVASLVDSTHPPPDELKELLARSGGVGAIPEEPVRLDAVDDDLRSALVVPMHSEGGTIGVLALYTTRRRFQPRELEVLRLYADRTAVAVENARLRRRHEQVAVLEERQRLARELHDSVSQSVYGVSLYAEAAARHLESGTIERAVEYLHELRDTAVEALRLMRLLIFEMRPSTLVESGLIAVLEERLASVEGRTGVSTDLQCNLEERLPSQIEDALHGIAHEALNNALKHAHAGRISVRLQGGDGGLSLELVDDGVGFDLDKARSRGGLGLRGMVERASRIGAELIIDSSPGEGTRVRVALGQGSGYPGRGVT